jgi:NAD(P)H-hydrate epimerase
MGIKCEPYDQVLLPIEPPGILVAWKQPRPNLIVDAIFGTGLSEPPRPPFDQIVQRVTSNTRHVLSVDLPSGLDCDTGRPLGPCIRAERTVTFVAQKIGFENPESRQYTGQITIADIGCPREAIEEAIRLHP